MSKACIHMRGISRFEPAFQLNMDLLIAFFGSCSHCIDICRCCQGVPVLACFLQKGDVVLRPINKASVFCLSQVGLIVERSKHPFHQHPATVRSLCFRQKSLQSRKCASISSSSRLSSPNPSQTCHFFPIRRRETLEPSMDVGAWRDGGIKAIDVDAEVHHRPQGHLPETCRVHQRNSPGPQDRPRYADGPAPSFLRTSATAMTEAHRLRQLRRARVWCLMFHPGFG